MVGPMCGQRVVCGANLCYSCLVSQLAEIVETRFWAVRQFSETRWGRK